jgi:pimeloyl-ACP methyl ester carboxylesterase
MPGWCANRTHFGELVSICAPQRRCLVIDWPGHGESGTPDSDFGDKDLIDAAKAVIEKSKATRVIPVSTAHAGWVAIELRRQLSERIDKIALLDWLVLDPPAPFLEGLRGLQSPNHWKQVRDALFATWLSEIGDAKIIDQVQRDIGSYGYEMWSRAGREIGAEYTRFQNPLRAMSELRNPPPILHLFSIPKDEAFLAEQQNFAKNHPWFKVRRLDGKTHFPSLECADVVAAEITDL